MAEISKKDSKTYANKMAKIVAGTECNKTLKELGVILREQTHVKAPDPDDEVEKMEQALLGSVKQMEEYGSTEDERNESDRFCTRECLRRYLRARNYNIAKSASMLAGTLKWRRTNTPHLTNPDDIEEEAVTGKQRVSLVKDNFGRPILLLDPAVENTKSHEGQMKLLAMTMEHSMSLMTDGVEKHVVFAHLDRFSIWKSVPLKTVKETVSIFTNHYPERLGHFIMYQMPWTFKALLKAARAIVDEVTYSKLVFINGDCSPGTDNDKILTALIGKDWKKATGATLPSQDALSSPGYYHKAHWAAIKEQYAIRIQKHKKPSDIAASTSSSSTTEESSVAEASLTTETDKNESAPVKENPPLPPEL